MFEEFIKPVVFAHSGACALAPENTISSFELAVAHGADAVELDAKLSKDGQVMVIHDPTLERTTNGKGKVNEFTLKELKKFVAGSNFGVGFSGERIPTLEEVFEHVGKKLLVNVELTNYKSPQDDLIPRVVELVKKHNMQQRVLFSSFLPKNLINIRVLIPEAAVAQLSLRVAGMVTRSNVCGMYPQRSFTHT
jgi:glycerophosphoryl diester phosphodiesterase